MRRKSWRARLVPWRSAEIDLKCQKTIPAKHKNMVGFAVEHVAKGIVMELESTRHFVNTQVHWVSLHAARFVHETGFRPTE